MKKLLKKEIGFILLELIATAADSLCIAAIPYLEKHFKDRREVFAADRSPFIFKPCRGLNTL